MIFTLSFILSLLNFGVPDIPLEVVNPIGYVWLIILIIIQSLFLKIHSEKKAFEHIGGLIWDQVNNNTGLSGFRAFENRKKKEFYKNMAVLNFSFAFFAFTSILITLHVYGMITTMTISLSFLFVGVSIKSLESGIAQVGVSESYTDKLRKETLSTITSQTESLFILLSITIQFAYIIENSIYEDGNFIQSTIIITAVFGFIFIPAWVIYKQIKI